MNTLKIKQTRNITRNGVLWVLLILCALLISPTFGQAQSFRCEWAHAAGKEAQTQPLDQAVDAAGNIYVTGNFLVSNMSFDNSNISLPPNQDHGANKVYLAKYAPDGHLIWAKSFESGFDASGGEITIDQENNIYLAGFFGTSITFGNMTLIDNTGNSNFIAKFDSSGNILWAESASFYPQFQISPDGHVILYGAFNQPTLTLGANFTLTNSDNSGQSFDLFIIEQAPDGSILWAKSGGAAGYNESISHIAFGSNGDIFACGSYDATFTLGGTTLNTVGNLGPFDKDWFVAKYNSSGNISWVKSGGTVSGDGLEMASGQNGDLYVYGSFQQSTTNFDGQILNGIGTANSYNPYWFAGKYDAAGNLKWAESGGSPVHTIQLIPDNDGSVSFIGMFHGTATFGNTTITGTGAGQGNGVQDFDGFAGRMDANGQVLWAKHYGPHLSGYLMRAVTDNQGILSFSGVYGRSGFAPTTDSTISFDGDSLTSLGYTNIFLARYDNQGNILSLNNIGSVSGTTTNSPLVQAEDGSLFVYGRYGGIPVIMDSITLNFPVNQNGNYFLAKFGIPNADTGTGIQNITGKNSLQVFPNPTSGIIHLQTSERISVIRVINIIGQEIYHKVLDAPQKAYTIDLSKQPKGIYWIEVRSRKGASSEKVFLK